MHMNIPEHIDALLETERLNLQNSGELDDATITEFFELRTQSEKVIVNFSGGIQKRMLARDTIEWIIQRCLHARGGIFFTLCR